MLWSRGRRYFCCLLLLLLSIFLGQLLEQVLDGLDHVQRRPLAIAAKEEGHAVPLLPAGRCAEEDEEAAVLFEGIAWAVTVGLECCHSSAVQHVGRATARSDVSIPPAVCGGGGEARP